MSGSGAADPLREVVAAADPALAEHAAEDAEADPALAERLAERPDRAFVAAAVREAHDLHYGQARAFPGLDQDLRLLGGDSLYALGLARLAAAGDLEGVAELADLISACARAHAEGRPEVAEELWRASLATLAGDGATGARATFERLAPGA